MTTGVGVLTCCRRLRGLRTKTAQCLLLLLCLGLVESKPRRYPAVSLELPSSLIRERNPRSPQQQQRQSGSPRHHQTRSKNSSPVAANPPPIPGLINLRGLEGLEEDEEEGGLRDYNSYEKFNPDQFDRSSPEWNLAMIRFLLDMKKNGHKINEFVANKRSDSRFVKTAPTKGATASTATTPKRRRVSRRMLRRGQEQSTAATVTRAEPLPALQEHLSQTDISVEAGGPIICKMEPFNICYKVDDDGNMHPVGDRRPVRLLRVYKK